MNLWRLALAGGSWLLTTADPKPPRAVKYQSNSTQRYTIVVAHEDDWQLFMGDRVATGLAGGDSTTFVYLTAGDDGRDSLYWRTRERAALQSTRIAIDPSMPALVPSCVDTVVRQHTIRACSLGNTRSFFLRLPDGRRNGTGFERYGRQSLRKLRSKKISTITAVDRSATYSGWRDLMETVSALIDSNRHEASIMVHTTDPSVTINPHDHFDHRMAGLLVADVRKSNVWDATYYVGYALATRAANRSTVQAHAKGVIFRAYDAEMIAANKTWSAYAEHPAFYAQCMLRTYFRRAPRSPALRIISPAS
jgi:LmbE family N-acetylglucosaminyl deacetylase